MAGVSPLVNSSRALKDFKALCQVVFQIGQQWAKQRLSKDKVVTSLPCSDVVSHVFSCEIGKQLQTWIMKAHSPKMLVGDIKEMEKGMVMDCVSQSYTSRPSATAVFCGWVCHDATLGVLQHISFVAF